MRLPPGPGARNLDRARTTHEAAPVDDRAAPDYTADMGDTAPPIDLSALLTAFGRFSEAIGAIRDDLHRDGAIQRYREAVADQIAEAFPDFKVRTESLITALQRSPECSP